MKAAVVISTCNSPDWLEKVLWGYSVQSHRDFEIIIADDGSGPDTRERIDSMRAKTRLRINHQWHEAPDYQRQRILNQCIRATDADYLIFTDGDCIPRVDLVAEHLRRAARGFFLSGGYVKLPLDLSRSITPEDIAGGRCFGWSWLYCRGLRGASHALKLAPGRSLAALLNHVTPTRPTWNNCNSSGWKADLIAVNGFDERMKYGGSDRELGTRLEHSGVRRRQIRHTAIVLHLDHARGYATPDVVADSQAIRAETNRLRKVWTEHGITKGPRPTSARLDAGQGSVEALNR